MATLHNFHLEMASDTIGAGGPASGDLIAVYDTSAGKTVLAQISDITGAGRIIASKDTTGALTTAPDTIATHTITSSNIAAADKVVVTLRQGTNTITGYALSTVTPAAGTAVVTITNGAATLAGTIVLDYLIFKAT